MEQSAKETVKDGEGTGGTKRKQQLEKWSQSDSIWSFTVNSHEVCKQLHKPKCDVKMQLECTADGSESLYTVGPSEARPGAKS